MRQKRENPVFVTLVVFQDVVVGLDVTSEA